MYDFPVPEPVSARLTFLPDRAHEFLDDGRLVSQFECETVEEVMEYVNEFKDALENAVALVGNRVICLSGEVYNAKTNEDIEE